MTDLDRIKELESKVKELEEELNTRNNMMSALRDNIELPLAKVRELEDTLDEIRELKLPELIEFFILDNKPCLGIHEKEIEKKLNMSVYDYEKKLKSILAKHEGKK